MIRCTPHTVWIDVDGHLYLHQTPTPPSTMCVCVRVRVDSYSPPLFLKHDTTRHLDTTDSIQHDCIPVHGVGLCPLHPSHPSMPLNSERGCVGIDRCMAGRTGNHRQPPQAMAVPSSAFAGEMCVHAILTFGYCYHLLPTTTSHHSYVGRGTGYPVCSNASAVLPSFQGICIHFEFGHNTTLLQTYRVWGCVGARLSALGRFKAAAVTQHCCGWKVLRMPNKCRINAVAMLHSKECCKDRYVILVTPYC